MPVHNAEIADQLNELADLLEVEGANAFRIRAYRNAARTVSNMTQSLAGLVAEKHDLRDLPGIGDAIARKIETIVSTGRLPQLEKVEARTPAALSELMKIEGLGPKRVKALYQELDVRSLEDLMRAARGRKIRELPGFGARTEEKILHNIERYRERSERMRLAEAEDIAAPLVKYLKKIAGVKRVTIAGSFRRCRETVGDLDILVTAGKDSQVMKRFVAYEDVAEKISQGDTRSTVVLRSGLQVDLRLVPQSSYGAALYYFTGSRAHNIAVRGIAAQKGLKLNEYGLFRGKRRVAGKTEEEVLAHLGLPYIPPELRENCGEIEAALDDRLPQLVRLEDIRGDLHCHTSTTDGRHSLQQMAEAARARGYEYLAITDHSRRVAIANGMDEKRLKKQLREIDRINGKLDGTVILKSAEVDILEDGSLDLPDRILKDLDLTVCAVHFRGSLSRAKQTERIIRAMDNPYFSILAHPGGRLLNERPGLEFDLPAILQAAGERGCIMEVNAQPTRMDLTDSGCQLAKQLGVKLAVSTDAHSTEQFDFMRYGVGQARRGWVEAGDVVNTRRLDDLRRLLKRR